MTGLQSLTKGIGKFISISERSCDLNYFFVSSIKEEATVKKLQEPFKVELGENNMEV